MVGPARQQLLADLRGEIARIEQGAVVEARHCLPFRVAAVDRHLPGGGLPLGALHEVTSAAGDLATGAAAALFIAGILARLPGPVLWCIRSRDLFAPGLAAAGLHPDRVIYAEGYDDTGVLLIMEEGLRHGGLAAVVGEVSRLALTAGRRLQLAAEPTGVTPFVLRRWRGQSPAPVEPTVATTRWQITALPPPPRAHMGRMRWRVELTRCRGAEPCSWILEACDATGRLAVPSDLADRSAAAEAQRACR